MDLRIGIQASDPLDHHKEYERQVTFHANTSIGQELLKNLINRLRV